MFREINQECHLLTPRELGRIQQINVDQTGGIAYREIMTWILVEITKLQQCQPSDATGIDSHLANQLRELVIELRRSIATLYDYHDQPVSFYIVHFICLLSAIYLPLSAIRIAINIDHTTTIAISSSSYDNGSSASSVSGLPTHDDYVDRIDSSSTRYYHDDDGKHNPLALSSFIQDILGGLLVLVQCIFILGLRLMANKMEKPYNGYDVKDLSVIHYISKFTFPQNTPHY